jgi:hypothetical protein
MHTNRQYYSYNTGWGCKSWHKLCLITLRNDMKTLAALQKFSADTQNVSESVRKYICSPETVGQTLASAAVLVKQPQQPMSSRIRVAHVCRRGVWL